MARVWDETDQLRRWHQNLANGSEVYADVSARRLRAFCTDSETSASKLLGLDVPDLRALLEDYLSREKKRGHSGEYIRTTLKAVRSWRVYNDKPAVEGLKVPNATVMPRVEGEAIPSQDELRRVLLAAKPHERVAIALMAFSGCRPQVIGNYTGTDGLRLSDLPELEIDKKSVTFSKIPALIKVRAANSKAKHGYLTFLGEEGCQAVVQYLQQRQLAGEVLDGETDLVHPDRASKRFVRALNIGDGVRRAMRSAGLDQRPYVWRSYFLSRLLEASNSGKASDRYIEFWAGHRGDVTAKHYTTGRPNLSPSMIEDMRAAYQRCEPFLSTAKVQTNTERDRRSLTLLLRIAGVSEPEIAMLDLDKMTDEELIALAESKRTAQQGSPLRSGQRAVALAEVGPLLDAGWEYVAPLGRDRAVLRMAVSLSEPPFAIGTH